VQNRVEGERPSEPHVSFTRQTRWIIAPPEELNGGAISWSEICGCACIARLLLRKGFANTEEVQTFLRPRLKSLSDPFLLPNMSVAVERVLAALDRGERIVCSDRFISG
jgi:single-stranded-DNA-specific exonuclease